MSTILCATTSNTKFTIGKQALAKYGILLEQIILQIDEIQGENPETIIHDKASRAFELVKKPLIVTDDCWSIPGLKGFPGPYMKSVMQWFTLDDWLRLTGHLTERTIVLNQLVAYIDTYETVIFRHDAPGKLLRQPRGTANNPVQTIVAFDKDNGLSMAQILASPLHSQNVTGDQDAWHQLAEWYARKSGV